MHEIPILMSNEEFLPELYSIKQIMDRERALGHGYDRRVAYLIGYVTADTAHTYTPKQLSQIFDLAK